MEKQIIARCRVSKNGQKLITIPKDSKIEAGDYVIIKLVNEK